MANRNRGHGTAGTAGAVKLSSKDPRVQALIPSLSKIAGGDNKIGQGFVGGAELGENIFGSGALGRLNEGIPPELQNILDRARGESFLGGHQQTADVGNSLDLLHSAASHASMDDPEVQRVLAQKQGLYDKSGTMDPLMQRAYDLAQSRLGGMSPAEITAEREQGAGALNQGLQSSLAALRANNIGGPRGAALGVRANPITSQFAGASGDLERKLINDAYNSKTAAANQFEGLSSDFSNTLFGRQTGTLNDLSNYLLAQQGQAANTAANYNTGAANEQKFQTADRADRFRNYQDLFNTVYNGQLAAQTFNLNQVAKEKAGLYGSIFDTGSFAASQEGRKEANDIALKALKAQQNGIGGGGGGSSASSGTGFAPPQLSTQSSRFTAPTSDPFNTVSTNFGTPPP